MRPNFFANTPDILHEYLVHGGQPAFKIRAALAALLSPAWGIYSGFELCENIPLRPGSEEYLDSEKYQFRPRDWDAARRDGLGIAPFITDLNRIRKQHPALHWLRNLRFHHADQPELICFSKRVPGREITATGTGTESTYGAGNITERSSVKAAPQAGEPGGATSDVVSDQGPSGESDTVLAVVNLDPHQPREATVWLDMPALGMDWDEEFTATDELTGESYRWGKASYVRLDPAMRVVHIFTVTRDSA
jgi:starch synthase (maltosyl-transferring)